MILEQEITEAVREFWQGRSGGTQAAVHDRAFLTLVARELTELGWHAHIAGRINDPDALVGGHFRRSKTWDIVCREPETRRPLICVEFKSQVGSYGNNENNRYEEALGSGLDARVRHGPEIVLGFFLVLCEESESSAKSPFSIPDLDPAFANSSHVDRREIFARRIVQFRMNDLPFYDAAAVLLVHRDGTHRIPDDRELDLRTFAERLSAAATARHP